MLRFRATYQPIEYIEHKINALFPELDSLISIIKEQQQYQVVKDGEQLSLTDFDKTQIQKWRTRTFLFSWIRPEDFPWSDAPTTSKKQLAFDDEHQNRMLILGFISPIDQQKNILAITFPAQTNFFGLKKQLQQFTTDEKVIVAELLHQLLAHEYYQAEQEIKSLQLLDKFHALKSQHQLASTADQAFFFNYFKNNCHELLQPIANQLTKKIAIAENCYAYLAQQFSNNQSLTEAFSSATELALLIDPTAQYIELTTLHFETILAQNSGETKQKNDKDLKVKEMLDRYETAAQIALQKGLIINGKNVAALLVPVISPPAITDAIKKNRLKIERLLREHPYEWQLIRSHLKPLKEMNFLPLSNVIG